MNGEKNIFGEETPGDNYENVSTGPLASPVPPPTRDCITSRVRPMYGFTPPVRFAYGAPGPDSVMSPSITAYMAPEPDAASPWKPAPYVPFVAGPNPYIFPTPDVFADTMKELQELGLKATDALRLLAICDWACPRALAITKACRKDGIWDILRFARELMGK